MAKASDRNIKLLAIIPLMPVAIVIANHLYGSAVHAPTYLGLQTVPCIDRTKPILQSYQFDIRIEENGQNVPVESTIGHDYGNCLHAIHTDDASGGVRIESNYADNLTLGQFFDVWKKTFNDHQMDNLMVGNGHNLKVTVNGQSYMTNLRSILLKPNEQISVIYQ